MSHIDDKSTTHDPLTGLLNHEGLNVIALHAIARASRDGESISLVSFHVCPVELPETATDPDDLAAELVVDEALITLGRVLRAELRRSDVAARVGPRELVVLLVRTDADQAMVVLEQLAGVLFRDEDTFPRAMTVQVGRSTFEPSFRSCDLNSLLEVARLDISLSNRRWENSTH